LGAQGIGFGSANTGDFDVDLRGQGDELNEDLNAVGVALQGAEEDVVGVERVVDGGWRRCR
jgi:hypothetical protein